MDLGRTGVYKIAWFYKDGYLLINGTTDKSSLVLLSFDLKSHEDGDDKVQFNQESEL